MMGIAFHQKGVLGRFRGRLAEMSQCSIMSYLDKSDRTCNVYYLALLVRISKEECLCTTGSYESDRPHNGPEPLQAWREASAGSFSAFEKKLIESSTNFNSIQILTIPFRLLTMAGIKRRQADDTDKTESKKLKTDSTNKSEKKHALKMARKDSKSSKTPKSEGKENLTIQLKEKKKSSTDKASKEKKEKKTKKVLMKDESENEEEEMEVDEDVFEGFASSDSVETPAFRPLSDDEDSEEEGGEEEEEEKPAKKSKKDGEVVAEVNPNNPNGMFLSRYLLDGAALAAKDFC